LIVGNLASSGEVFFQEFAEGEVKKAHDR
jgi:hypothetical protein